MGAKAWFQLWRAQTAPATLMLVLVPYLTNTPFFDLNTVVLSVLLILAHYFSFGHNSLMDTAMLYDQRDVHKKHHPLILGEIKLHTAHNIIHCGLVVLTLVMALLTAFLSPAVGIALFCLVGWISFGHSYNDGLSKESLFGFLTISICMTFMAGWGWFLSNRDLNPVGIIYLAYVFFTILYQTGWSGFIKEISLQERSNILAKLGASVDVTWKGEKKFIPGNSRFFAYLAKGGNLFFAGLLTYLNHSLVTLVAYVLIATITAYLLYKTTRARVYDRKKELIRMSFMEIVTIYTPIILMLPLAEAGVLMMCGLTYFWTFNKMLWGSPLFPKV